ncbi:stalk domain-containing protein [Paenibacillus alginolyticus]|uniref:Stalk domain-containing protein n=1 Tax=Paenibacillus alginolyticus TaxID=59839 RepID=A0ABT4GGC5_9BACL|nr:copper amine oxidase N-terminal domain-containing protein [Paenibacillus alginolyticus]MCY9668338.1 stalk domain-containing protein [Paenibacillus alginolyticus]MCY9695246.1 stalk domain-containing protein [Paenibacillus alginolyticus]MEC0144863.1 stalk domain-containing protein [Paenibacillus alginolyticus]
MKKKFLVLSLASLVTLSSATPCFAQASISSDPSSSSGTAASSATSSSFNSGSAEATTPSSSGAASSSSSNSGSAEASPSYKGSTDSSGTASSIDHSEKNKFPSTTKEQATNPSSFDSKLGNTETSSPTNLFNSTELRLGDESESYVTQLNKDNLSFEDVMKISSSVGNYRSKLDKTTYEKYVVQQKAENDLFDLKQNVDSKSNIPDQIQALKSNPKNNNLYVELALKYIANGDLTNAENIANQLDAKAPGSYLSLLLKAELAGVQDKPKDKQIYLQKAIEINPSGSVAMLKLGEELTQAGKSNEAIAYLSAASALNPKNEKVFEALNTAFSKSGNTELKTYVNGVIPKFEVKPFIENGSTLVPVRAISEALDAKIDWNGEKQEVFIQREDTIIQLTIGSNVAKVNGKEVSIEAPAATVNGNTVLPLRFISESLGAKVDWKSESQMIVISK